MSLVVVLRRTAALATLRGWMLRQAMTALGATFRAKDLAKLEYGERITEMFAIGRKYHVHRSPT